MTLTFAIISIIGITCLMILAMFLRTKSRENTQYHAIDFCYEGYCWKIAIRKARFWRLLYTQVKIVPGDLLSFRPQVAYTVCKNGRVIIALPNFWADSIGAALCKITEHDSVAMQIEIVFKDLPMSLSFVESLMKAGYSADEVSMRHNLVIFETPLSTKNHNCNNQRCDNADNIGENRARKGVTGFRDTDV